MRRTKLPVLGAVALLLLAFAAPVSAESGAPGPAPPEKKSAAKSPAPTAQPPVAASPPAEPARPSAPPSAAVRIQDLEQRIDEQKEEARRRYTREALLRDSASHGVSGSWACFRFETALSPMFVVTRVRFVVDGVALYTKSDPSGALGRQPLGLAMFSGQVPPGDHVVQMTVDLRGSALGVFSYLRGYRFHVQSTHTFTAVEGKTTTVHASAQEKGDVTTPFEQRPAVRYADGVVDGAPTGCLP